MEKPFSASKGFEIETDILVTQMLNGVADPTQSPGVSAPVSSSYTRSEDQGGGVFKINTYDKTGAADTDWTMRVNADTVSGAGVIGVPTDGTYADGLLTLTPSTKTGDAVDAINEFLTLMAPPPAPILSNLYGNNAGASGKLSFDTTHTIAGYAYDATAINALVAAAGGTNLGILNNATVVTGILNNSIVVSSAGSYPAKSFGPGNTGLLQLWVNDTKVHEVDLSSFASGSTLTSGSGFVLSASTPCKFSNGNDFTTLQYRTGTFTAAVATQRPGYNKLEVRHVAGTTNTTNLTIWYNDADATAITGSGFALAPTMGTMRDLSGVKYYSSGTVAITGTVQHAFADVYSPSASAISFSSAQATLSAAAMPTTTSSTATLPISASGAISTGIRLLGATSSVVVSVLHPIKTTYTSSAIASGTILFDATTTNAALVESFNNEQYRASTVPGAAATAPTAYDSTANVVSGGGLQCYNGLLRYPTGDFRSTGDGGSIAFAPSGNPNYTGATGTKTFIRAFQNTSGSVKANYKFNIAGTTTTFAAVGSLTGNNISVEAKFPPGALSAGTGWTDTYLDFSTGNWADGAGSRATSYGLGRALATDWGVTVGTQSIAANEWVYLRITAPASWTGSLDSITFTWL